MEIEDLLDFLQIESPSEFAYFEHLADLVECDETVSYDAFYTVLSQISSNVLVDITDNYFEDIQLGLPDDSVDLFTLLDTIKQALLGLAQNIDDVESRVLYVDELYKFRNWYTFEGIVHCHRLNDNHLMDVTISEALSISRLEKLSQEEYAYDFSDCLAYDLDEYTLSFAADVDAKVQDDYDEYSGDGDEDRNLYEEALIDMNNPVIDGEDYDEDYKEPEENFY